MGFMNAIKSFSFSLGQTINFPSLPQLDKRILAVVAVALCCIALAFLYFKKYFFQATPSQQALTKKPRVYYEGMTVDGRYHGKGELMVEDGLRYEGDFVQGKKHGNGTCIYHNCDKYVGEFADDNIHGKGVYTFRNGDEYEGEFVDDKMQGKGTLITHVGHLHHHGIVEKMYRSKYEGDFVNGKIDGKGIFTCKAGKFEGQYENGKRISLGIKILPDGTKVPGDYSEGKDLTVRFFG